MEIIINSKKHGNKTILIDDEDFEEFNKNIWTVYKNLHSFYIKRMVYINNKRTVLNYHRQILKLFHGDNSIVDHINHNGLDNRKCNLRIVTKTQNNQNSTSRKNSSSKYLGVAYNKRDNKWQANIRINKKLLFLGYFPFTNEGEINAAKTYNKAAIKYFGEFANLNIINN